MSNVLLPVARLRALCDPFETPPWEDSAMFSVEAVARAVAAGELQAKPFSGGFGLDWSFGDHSRRVAYLVVHGRENAIEVDFGVPVMGLHVYAPVQDGYHRLAAAIYRGDEFILASVGGDVDYAFELFGMDCAGDEAA